jgi:hypothetical protein
MQGKNNQKYVLGRAITLIENHPLILRLLFPITGARFLRNIYYQIASKR